MEEKQLSQETTEAIETVETEAVVEVEETMDDYKDMIDGATTRVSVGDIVEGEVVSISEDGLVINFGYIADGLIIASETLLEQEQRLEDAYEVGAKVKAEVLRTENEEGNVILSIKKDILT